MGNQTIDQYICSFVPKYCMNANFTEYGRYNQIICTKYAIKIGEKIIINMHKIWENI
jgi:hypothetical protein